MSARNSQRPRRNSGKPDLRTRLLTSSISTPSRFTWVFILFGVLVVGCGLRLLDLQVLKAADYSQQAQDARTSVTTITPKRGTIYDRNGNVLATSVEAKTVYVNPKEVKDAEAEAVELANVLGGKAQDYSDKLKNTSTTFAYIKRKIDMDKAEELKDKKLAGIHFLPDTKRVYPHAQVGGQVVGFVNVDDEGISGLELYYNDILKGTPGKMVAEYGRTGIPIPGGVEKDTPAIPGQDIVISLDIGMQEYLEQRLSEGVDALEGKSGNSVLMDGATGEIYAIASLPYFNPKDLKDVKPGATDLKSITQAFEPGSIFKPVACMAALEDGILKPTDEIFCPAALPADEYYVTDAHERGDETMSFRDILNRSSNVGMSLVASRVGFPEFYKKILDYKLNDKTGVDSPGEASGFLADQKKWSLIQAYNVSFGQGVSVTPLQMARFYGALSNDGKAPTPHFLISKPHTDEHISYPDTQIIQNTKAIPSMVSMLETVVSNGTGKDAAIDGFKVAGKTGTAEFADQKGGYVKGVYNISFIGFLPDTTSHLVCFVGASEVPGDRITTPIFKDIMKFAIERYKITAR